MTDDIKIRPFKWRDGLKLADDPNEKGLKGNGEIEKWLKLNESEGPGFTAIYKDEIVACGGVRIFWKGCGEAWFLTKNGIGSYHIDPQIVKDQMNKIIVEHELIRVQATPRTDWAPGLSYVRWLGFKIEGKMRKYLPDANGQLVDCYMMSIVKE
jgi:hypothetical protein